jgi:spore maturation protein CgeB
MDSTMRFAFFYHSLMSDWNHGNAHFLRGVVRELSALGHQVDVYEPLNGWSLNQLIDDQGSAAINGFFQAYPGQYPILYDLAALDLEKALFDVDVVIAHEWSSPELLAALAAKRRNSRFLLFFHDTHHRAITRPEELATLPLQDFDGILAYGEALREVYLRQGWGKQVWTWHEGADTALFQPSAMEVRKDDLIWIGNWGDEERAREIREFLIFPMRVLGLRASLFGVRYPQNALQEIRDARGVYHGWIPNYLVPAIFAHFHMTVHIPRQPYVHQLPGIPTIRVFEALACGIPLISSPWDDCEGLFRPGQDYLLAADGAAMTKAVQVLRHDHEMAAALAASGLETIRRRHTCCHRVAELLDICGELSGKWQRAPAKAYEVAL